jgi:hypothetical protein
MKEAGGITWGTLSINKAGKVWGNGMTPKVLWQVVREGASQCSIQSSAARTGVGLASNGVGFLGTPLSTGRPGREKSPARTLRPRCR